nr:hypothetical protein [Tanacetum cinerariifolium]
MSIQEMEDLKQQYLDEMKRLINSDYHDEIKIAELKENFNGMSIEIRKKEKLQQLDQWANLSTSPSKRFNSFCYDDDDEDYTLAVIPSLSTEKPDNSLKGMEIVISKVRGIDDDILLTINDDILREKLLNVNLLFAKIEALNDNPTPFYDPIVSGTLPTLTPFRESDFFLEESCSDEDVPEKIFSTPLFDEEIIHMKMDQHHHNVESDLMESLRIDETDCDFKEDIRLIEKLLYDNSSPRPPKEFVSTNSDTKIGSFSPSPIPVKDSDSLMEEIDLSFTPDYPMPPKIEDDDYDSERDILILKELPSNDTLLIPEI